MRLQHTFLLSCLLWFAVAAHCPVEAGKIDDPFWRKIRLHMTFLTKQEGYKIRNFQPSGQKGKPASKNTAANNNGKGSYQRFLYSRLTNRDQDRHESDKRMYDPTDIISFTGSNMAFSAQLLLSVDVKRLRIGIGSGIKVSFLNKMIDQFPYLTTLENATNRENGQPRHLAKNDGNEVSSKCLFTSFPSFLLGYKMIAQPNHALWLDATWTPIVYNITKCTNPYYWTYQQNFDLGSSWEYAISHYTNVSLRVGYGFSLQKIVMPDPIDISRVAHSSSGLICQLGINMRIPTLNSCPIAGCSTRLDHKHGAKEYRGNGLFTCKRF